VRVDQGAQRAVPLSRGSLLLANRKFLEVNYGEEAFPEVVARMRGPHAPVLNGIVLPGNWYPTALMVDMVDAAVAVFGQNDDKFLYRLGVFNADYDLKGIHKFVLRFTSPLWVLERGAKLWSDFHNTGAWTIESPDPRRLIGTLRDFAGQTANQCQATCGFLARMGQLTGARQVRIEHPVCCSAGAAACVFRADW